MAIVGIMRVIIKAATWFQLLLFGLVAIVVIHANCPPDGTDFIIIDENNYDRNYSKISEDGKRPLGFMKGIVYYNNPQQNNPCIKLTNTGDKRVEIMAVTDPPARICVHDQTGGNQICAQESIYDCRQTIANIMYFEFYCDSRCGESDVTFWYRFALSPPGSEMDPEMWCAARDTNQYPSTLLGIIPPSVDSKPAPTDKVANNGSIIRSCFLLILICLSFF